MKNEALERFRDAQEKSKRELEEMLNVNPLLAYSTTQLKNELRRRKKNGNANGVEKINEK